MKISRLAIGALTVTTLIGLVGLSHATRSVNEKYDLTPRFEKDQKLEITSNIEISFDLEDAELSMGGQPFPMTPSVNINIEGEDVTKETVEAVGEDGELLKLKREYDTSDFTVTGQAGMGEQVEEIDEEEEGPLSGRILRIEKDEEGEVEITDITNEGKEEDEHLEELEESKLALVDLENHFQFLLPTKTVAVGDSWDIAKPFVEKITKMVGATAAAQEEEDAEKIQKVFDTVLQNFEATATGKLTAVEDGIGTIKYTVEAKLSFDDLGGMISELAGDAEDVPEDIDGEIVMEMNMKGSGKFDLEKHQLAELSLEGAFELSLDISMTIPQGEIEMSATGPMSGTLNFSGGVEVQ